MANKNLLFRGKEYFEYADYWTSRLTKSDPFVFKRSVQGEVGVESFLLDDNIQEILYKYTDGRDLELFVFLFTGLYVCLNKYNNQNVIINTPLINEQAEEIWQSYVPLMLTLDAHVSLKEIIQLANNEILTSYKYQNYPFDVLSDKSLHNKFPLSNIFFYCPAIHVSVDRDQLNDYDLIFELAKDLTGKIKITLHYKGIIDTRMATNFCRHYKKVTSYFNDLNIGIKDIEILSSEEKEKLLVTFNNTQANYPEDKRVVELFEEQVSKNPEAIAVIFHDRKLTYRELNDKSNSLANYLITQFNIVPNTPVASFFDKSEYAIVSLLGILKAGAIYVPVDPSNPAERVYHIISDARIEVLLTTSDNLYSLEKFSGTLIALDIQTDIFEMPPLNHKTKLSVDDSAYIIYTSGSTGNAKGVVIQHRGLVNVAIDHIKQFNMTQNDVYLLFMALSFDGSLLDIFTTLLSGATLLIPDKALINNTSLFLHTLVSENVSVMTVTPSYLNTLDRESLAGIRVLVSAGEAAKVDDAVYYAKNTDFYNGYGPSEVTVNATLYKVDGNLSYTTIPIGKPRANKQIFILDQYGALVPEFVTAEICISGIGLAQGYLNDEALTQEKFVINPYNTNQLLYKSGDLGYWLPDGNIEYVGRIDTQVKINGFRVDIGEIERALLSHSQIKSSLVLFEKSPKTAKKELVAFYEKKERMELVPSLGEYLIYDSFLYEAMATDAMREKAYKEMLRKHVANKIVLDPGTGSEMILARHCIEAGARKVYAIEIEHESYLTALQNIKKHGLEDKICLIYGDITQVEIPENIDYVVSALAGNISSSDGCIPIINKLKEKLSQFVNFIPNRYQTYVSAVTLTDENFDEGFSEISLHYIEQVYKKIGYPFDLRLCLKNFKHDSIISTAEVCEDLNYQAELKAEDSKTIKLKVVKNGFMSGLVFWINASYNEDLMINSYEKTHHLPVFFPVFENGIEVKTGDTIEFIFTRSLSENDINPDYKISGWVSKEDMSTVHFNYASYNQRRSFRQSPFYQKLFSSDGISKKLKQLSSESLKEYIGSILPYYMIPNKLVEVYQYPINSNNKIDKNALYESVDEGKSDDQSIYAPRNKAESLLVEIWKSVLGTSNIGIMSDFFMLGGDSIKAIQIASRLYKEGYKLEVKHIFESPVLVNLANLLKLQLKIPDQSKVTGEIGLTPVQKEFLLSGYNNISHYNQAILLENKNELSEEIILEIFKKLQDHHDALRITLSKESENNYRQFNNNTDYPVYIQSINLTGDDDYTYIKDKANELQKSIDLANGPLMKLALFKGLEYNYLLIVIHHLVIDGVSWRILLEDINFLYENYVNGQDVTLPLKTDSYKTWSEKLSLYANSPGFLKETNYWKSLKNKETVKLKRDFGSSGNYIKDNAKITAHLSEEQTKLLITNVHKFFGTEINDILLTAYITGIKNTFNISEILINLEGHGREEILAEIDISRTVGWFTCSYPVRIGIDGDDIESNIMKVKSQLNEIPNKGIGYGILKYLTNETPHHEMNFSDLPMFSFNYLGQFDEGGQNTFFCLSDGPTGYSLDLNEERRFEFEALGIISNSCFSLSVTYNQTHFKVDTVERLCANIKTALEGIIDLCSNRSYNEAKLPDFTFKDLSIEDLDSIFE